MRGRRSRAVASSLPHRSGSLREGGVELGRVEVLLILPLLQVPSLSSSFSLDASFSLAVARLIPPDSKHSPENVDPEIDGGIQAGVLDNLRLAHPERPGHPVEEREVSAQVEIDELADPTAAHPGAVAAAGDVPFGEIDTVIDGLNPQYSKQDEEGEGAHDVDEGRDAQILQSRHETSRNLSTGHEKWEGRAGDLEGEESVREEETGTRRTGIEHHRAEGKGDTVKCTTGDEGDRSAASMCADTLSRKFSSFPSREILFLFPAEQRSNSARAVGAPRRERRARAVAVAVAVVESHSRTGWTAGVPRFYCSAAAVSIRRNGNPFPDSVRVSRSSCALTPPLTRSHVEADGSLKCAAGASDEDTEVYTMQMSV
ncbi:hypothetical protein GW17_00004781 [Ensete ventricosum]|nr:hypothetical protein GW17_00004781 [Ensete ventricosum]